MKGVIEATIEDYVEIHGHVEAVDYALPAANAEGGIRDRWRDHSGM
jgi:hypothetical protein